jgi:enoyl-CoA hydratase/carnithine racemase
MIESQWRGEVAVVRLNRPEKKNALTPPMIDQLIHEIAAARESARALVLCGGGDVFCSGFDLALCLHDASVLAHLLRGLSRAIISLRHHPAPVIVAAHGAAIAGGCALLGGGDVVVTNRDAKLGYPVTPLGISPAVSAPFLAAAVGEGNARARLLEPRLVSGQEACRIGLAHECLPIPDDVLPHAMALASDLAGKPRSAIAATKAWLNEIDGSLDEGRAEQALEASLSLVGSPEERDRLKAFFAR